MYRTKKRDHAASEPLTNDPPMLFVRVVWMAQYNGDRIIYAEGNPSDNGTALEVYNFLNRDGNYYGCFRTGSTNKQQWPRLDPNEYLGNHDKPCVLIIFVSKRAKRATPVIVGWYANATVSTDARRLQKRFCLDYKGTKCDRFYAKAKVNDCILLPASRRDFPMPTEGGMGQAATWYARDQKSFRKSVLTYLKSWHQNHKKRNERRQGGRQSDPLRRSKTEKAAIEVTIRHFENLGYNKVTSVEKDNRGWDLTATSDRGELKLEVKGLSGTQICVELTPNEYAHFRKREDNYRLCVVTEALTAAPKLAVFTYQREIKRWRDEHGRILKHEPQTGARCRL